MFNVFNNGSKFIFHTKQLFLLPIFERKSYLSTLTYANAHTKTLDKNKNLAKSQKKSSFTVCYLINSCGLSQNSALYASEKVKFETPERADSVIQMLKKHGFSKTHISNFVRKQPQLLLSDPEKTLLPKLEFFRSFVISRNDFGAMVSSAPHLFLKILEDQLVPSHRFLKGVFHCDETVFAVMKHHTAWIFGYEKILYPNIAYLQKLSVPGSSIQILMRYPKVLLQNHEVFREGVEKVREMGFDPRNCTFVLALRVLSGTSHEVNWDRCFATYKKWGLSEDDILLAFHKHPICMFLPEKTIETKMDYFVNKMGYLSKMIAVYPSVLFFNLEKRIIPRCSVIQILTSKGLVKNVSLCYVLIPVEKRFLDRFVTRYEHKLPQLMNVYRGELNSLAA